MSFLSGRRSRNISFKIAYLITENGNKSPQRSPFSGAGLYCECFENAASDPFVHIKRISLSESIERNTLEIETNCVGK